MRHRVRDEFKSRCARLADECVDELAYRPLFATGLGSTDDCVVMLVDDLDKVTWLVAQQPSLESYVLSTTSSRPERAPVSGNFCSPDELLADYLCDVESSQPPLFAFSHIKLSWLVTLAAGEYAHRAAHELLHNCIQDVLELLTNDTSLSVSSLLDGAEPANTKFALLDPIANEDALLWVTTDNFSVAAIIVSMIRALQLGDLFDSNLQFSRSEELLAAFEHDTSLRGCMTGFDLLSAASNSTRQETKELTPFSENHLVLSTHTVLASDFDRIAAIDGTSNLYGHVLLRPGANVNPGHERDVEQFVKRVWGKVTKASRDAPATEGNPYKAELRFLVPGASDVSFSTSTWFQECDPDLIPTSKALLFIKHLFDGGAGIDEESGFQDLATTLEIPVPTGKTPVGERLNRSFDRERHLSLIPIHRRMELAFRRACGLEGENSTPLERAMDTLELSQSTRFQVTRLFGEFASTLGDPLLMDSVIDLIDGFAIVAKLIMSAATDVAPSRGEHGASESELVFDSAISALQQGFRLRVSGTVDARQNPFGDYRCGLSNLLSASDAIVKCATGFLRLCVIGRSESFATQRWDVSGVISHELASRPYMESVQRGSMYLTVTHLGVAHLFAPDLLMRVLHEVGHMYFNALIASDPSELAKEIQRINGRTRSDMPLPHVTDGCFLNASELFAEQFVYSFGFEADTNAAVQDPRLVHINRELFVQHQLRAFNASKPDSLLDVLQDGGEFEILVVSLEMLYRIYHIRYSGPDNSKSSESFHTFVKNHLPSVYTGPTDNDEYLHRLVNKLEKRREKDYAIVQGVLDLGIRTARRYFGNGDLYSLLDGYRPPDYSQLYDLLHLGIPVPFATEGYHMGECITAFRVLRHYISVISSPTGQNGCGSLVAFFTVMKSLWHISTRQKRRRVLQLLNDEVEPYSLERV